MIVQELLKQPRRYGTLLARLPGISTSVLADRLRHLERAGVVAREPVISDRDPRRWAELIDEARAFASRPR